MNYIIHDSSGRVLRTGSCPDDHVQLQARDGEMAIEGEANDGLHRIEDGKVIDLPPKPSANHVFDYAKKRWHDPRTPEQKTLDAANVIRANRAKQYPPIGDQLDALWHAMDAGVLPMVAAFYDPIAAVKAAHPKLEKSS